MYQHPKITFIKLLPTAKFRKSLKQIYPCPYLVGIATTNVSIIFAVRLFISKFFEFDISKCVFRYSIRISCHRATIRFSNEDVQSDQRIIKLFIINLSLAFTLLHQFSTKQRQLSICFVLDLKMAQQSVFKTNVAASLILQLKFYSKQSSYQTRKGLINRSKSFFSIRFNGKL